MADTEKPSQIDRFRETARRLGCDEDKEHFEKQLGEIAAHKPVKDEPARTKEKPAPARKKSRSS